MRQSTPRPRTPTLACFLPSLSAALPAVRSQKRCLDEFYARLPDCTSVPPSHRPSPRQATVNVHSHAAGSRPRSCAPSFGGATTYHHLPLPPPLPQPDESTDARQSPASPRHIPVATRSPSPPCAVASRNSANRSNDRFGAPIRVSREEEGGERREERKKRREGANEMRRKGPPSKPRTPPPPLTPKSAQDHPTSPRAHRPRRRRRRCRYAAMRPPAPTSPPPPNPNHPRLPNPSRTRVQAAATTTTIRRRRLTSPPTPSPFHAHPKTPPWPRPTQLLTESTPHYHPWMPVTGHPPTTSNPATPPANTPVAPKLPGPPVPDLRPPRVDNGRKDGADFVVVVIRSCPHQPRPPRAAQS
jgi:hypothetical protein